MTYLDRRKKVKPVVKKQEGYSHVLKFNPNHDPKTGRFATAGLNAANFTDLDRKLINHLDQESEIKGARSLTNTGQIRDIGKMIVGAKYVPYTQTDFFEKLQELQGTKGETDGHANEEARTKLMREQPIENVRIADLTFTQNVVNINNVAGAVSRGPKVKSGSGAVMVVRSNGVNYLVDGHHRTVSMYVMGVKEIQANVLDFDKKKVQKKNIWHEPAGSSKGGQFAKKPGSPGSTPNLTLSKNATIDRARQLASEIYTKSKAVEGKLTKLLERLLPPDSRLEGLEHRLKEVDSLVRKIANDSLFEKVSPEFAASKIGDAVRYTMVIDEKTYASKMSNVIEKLQQNGHDIQKFKNFWRQDKSQRPDYQGVNMTMRASNGLKWELQFHTEDSIKAKSENHKDYEKARLLTTSKQERNMLVERMRKRHDAVETPKGIVGLTR